MRNLVLVLDKDEYKNIENSIKALFLEKGYNVDIVHTAYEDRLIRAVRSWRLVGSILKHLLYWFKSYRYARQVLKLKNNLNIICINPIVGVFLGLANKKQERNIISCGFLFEEKSNKLYYNIRKRVTYSFMKGLTKTVVYGSNEVNYYKRLFDGLDKFLFVPYGIDYSANEVYDKQPLPREYIFSGGGSNRDYITLCEGYNLFIKERNVPLYIATLPDFLKGADITNVKVLQDVVLETFGDVISRSKAVVLSLKAGEISAGHQVLFQALKENKIILVNRIPAVEDYVNEDQVIFYESSNPEDLSSKLKYIDDNYNYLEEKYSSNSRFYYDNYTFISLLSRLIDVIEYK